MFSPTKAITAGALVFALGGVLLIAQPFDQQGGSVPGAETEAPTPVAFTARISMAGQASPGETETLGNGVERSSRVAWRGSSTEASDPRVEGTWMWTITWDTYPDGVEFNTGAGRIENDEGAWQQVPVQFFNRTDGRDTPSDYPMAVGETAQRVFIGEGGYQGLVAVAIQTGESSPGWPVMSLEGYILDGELPPLPEPFVAE